MFGRLQSIATSQETSDRSQPLAGPSYSQPRSIEASHPAEIDPSEDGELPEDPSDDDRRAGIQSNQPAVDLRVGPNSDQHISISSSPQGSPSSELDGSDRSSPSLESDRITRNPLGDADHLDLDSGSSSKDLSDSASLDSDRPRRLSGSSGSSMPSHHSDDQSSSIDDDIESIQPPLSLSPSISSDRSRPPPNGLAATFDSPSHGRLLDHDSHHSDDSSEPNSDTSSVLIQPSVSYLAGSAFLSSVPHGSPSVDPGRELDSEDEPENGDGADHEVSDSDISSTNVEEEEESLRSGLDDSELDDGTEASLVGSDEGQLEDQALGPPTDRPASSLPLGTMIDVPTIPDRSPDSEPQNIHIDVPLSQPPVLQLSVDPTLSLAKGNPSVDEQDGLQLDENRTSTSSTSVPPVTVTTHPNSHLPVVCARSESVQENQLIPSAQPQHSSEQVGSKLLGANVVNVVKDEPEACDPIESRSAGSSYVDSQEARLELEEKKLPVEGSEEQIEDDNDLFEGDEDLRLHRLGVERQALSNLNQPEELSSNLNPINETSSDRFSSIEQRVNDFLGREHHQPTVVEKELQQNGTHQEISVSAISTDQTSVVASTTTPIASNADVIGTENTLVGSMVQVQQSTEPNVNQSNATRALWGDLSSATEWTQGSEETRMDQLELFPLKKSDSSFSNMTSWAPALSMSISSGVVDSVSLQSCSQSSTVCFTLPRRPSPREAINLDEHQVSTLGHLKPYPDDSNAPMSSLHDRDDYDMLASSLTDGNSDMVQSDVRENRMNIASDTHKRLSAKKESILPARQTHNHTAPTVEGNRIDSVLLPGSDAIGSSWKPQASEALSSESDDLLAQFVNCGPDGADVNPDNLCVPDSPVPLGTLVPAVTFAASPPIAMEDAYRYGERSAPAQLLAHGLDDGGLNSAFEPQTPLTSTTQGRGTSSESSEQLLSRGSASLVTYSAPSSVVSSDADSVPASVAPPPPLPNASMGAPTEAVGLSNQITRRPSIDSSTHAEPPSPSTSTRQRSAPITQEQVNAPGLPHIEATEMLPSAISGLPDPLRSPPPMNPHVISNCPDPIRASLSQASSLVAHPPSPSFSTVMEGSLTSHVTPHRDPSPQLDTRLSLPDPRATPLPLSIPAIKLEDIPDACLSIERNISTDSSVASQAATSPGCKLSSIPSPFMKKPDSLIDANLRAVGDFDPSLSISSLDPHSPAFNPHPSTSGQQEITPDEQAPDSRNIFKSPTVEIPKAVGTSPGHDHSLHDGVLAEPVEVSHEPTTDDATEPSQDPKPDQNREVVTEPPEAESSEQRPPRNNRKRASKPRDPTYIVRSDEIEAEDMKEVDRESQLREILRKRRTSKPVASQTKMDPKNPRKRTNQNQKVPPAETIKKTRGRSAPKVDVNSECEIESNLTSDITDVEPKETPIRNQLPRAAKKSFNSSYYNLAPPNQSRSPSNATSRSLSPHPFPSSPINHHPGGEFSNSPSAPERDDRSVGTRARQSSRQSQSTSSPVVPNSSISVIVPLLKPEDAVPRFRLHQHNSKSPLYFPPVDKTQPESSHEQSNSDGADSKPVGGAGRPSRRKQSEGTEGKQLPLSLPPVTRSHCHFIRLQFQNKDETSPLEDPEKKFDTFLVPQCATGNEEIKSKMHGFGIIEEDNLTAEEQSRGIRIGHDGMKHEDERQDEQSSSCLLILKDKHSNFTVDEDRMNSLIEVFGLSLIQDGQVEVLLPRHYFKRLDDPPSPSPVHHELGSVARDEKEERKTRRAPTTTKKEEDAEEEELAERKKQDHTRSQPDHQLISQLNNNPSNSHLTRSLKRRAPSPSPTSPRSRASSPDQQPSSAHQTPPPASKSSKRKKSN